MCGLSQVCPQNADKVVRVEKCTSSLQRIVVRCAHTFMEAHSLEQITTLPLDVYGIARLSFLAMRRIGIYPFRLGYCIHLFQTVGIP